MATTIRLVILTPNQFMPYLYREDQEEQVLGIIRSLRDCAGTRKYVDFFKAQGGALEGFIDAQQVIGAYYHRIDESPQEKIAKSMEKMIDKGEEWRGP